MKLEINIEKKHLYMMSALVAVFFLAVVVNARYANPQTGVGHDASEIQVASGTWCGLYIENNGVTTNGPRDSVFLDNNRNTQNIPCKGINPRNSCPTGYKMFKATMTTWGDDPGADMFMTCVKT